MKVNINIVLECLDKDMNVVKHCRKVPYELAVEAEDFIQADLSGQFDKLPLPFNG